MTRRGGRGWRTFWNGKTGHGTRRPRLWKISTACAPARPPLVTGQQVGLFGGPLFSVFKALSTVKLADEATRAGSDCVPIFWLATSDHDLDEISHVSLLGPDGSLQKFSAPTRGLPDAPVGTVTFGPEIEPVVEAAAGLLGDSEVTKFLREAYRPGENFGSAFARLFSRLFADWGVICSTLPTPNSIASPLPIYSAAIERAAELDDALLARGRELEAAGYHQQVKVTPSSTLLFTLRDGARVPVHRRANGTAARSSWSSDETISQAELLRRDYFRAGTVQRQCIAAAGGAGLPFAHTGLRGRGGGDCLLRPGSGGL